MQINASQSLASAYDLGSATLVQMNAIVLIALKRPYTFVVLAILILIFGGRAALSQPDTIRQTPARTAHMPRARRVRLICAGDVFRTHSSFRGSFQTPWIV
jgi:hypothetical protein